MHMMVNMLTVSLSSCTVNSARFFTFKGFATTQANKQAKNKPKLKKAVGNSKGWWSLLSFCQSISLPFPHAGQDARIKAWGHSAADFPFAF